MIRRMAGLHARYEATHLALVAHGGTIIDASGEQAGHVDLVQFSGGRLRVAGWARADRVRLVHGGHEDSGCPHLRRPDVASQLGLAETLGFELSVPARIADLRSEAPPGLTLTEEQGRPPIRPLSLRIPVSRRARLLCGLRFLRDVTLGLPAALGWQTTHDPIFRARFKACLRLGTPLASGPLEPRLFDQSTAKTTSAGPRITIVLPVYNAFELLQLCLERVVAHTDLPWRLILIEDGSSDDRVRPFLRDWVRDRENVELLENPENLGFIRSVNRGLDRALDRDGPTEGPVVLLNSDALVPANWASRLVRPFEGDPGVASVTPMSNDAEIFSAPVICSRTPLVPGQGDAIDRVAADFAPEVLLSPAPTGVGFCMAMGRDWLTQVPQLDTTFGRGYGEEVDWCRKVARLGGRHLGLPGLFVEHRGGESFGSAEKQRLVAHNNEIVARRYPDYDESVQDFIAADPLRTARLALGLAWAGSLDPARPVPIYMAHDLGGGAEHYLEQRIEADLAEGWPSVVLRVGGSRRWQIELATPGGRCHGRTDDTALARRLLSILPHRHVVYSCGVGDRDPVELPQMLLSLMTEDGSAELLFHDFYPLAPAYTLLDRTGAYRGPPVGAVEDPGFSARRPDGTRVDLAGWQAAWKAFAERAELVVFSRDSARIVAAVWPDLAPRLSLRPHRLRHTPPPLRPVPDGRPVLGVLGNIGLQKGAGVVQTLGRRLAAPGTPGMVLIGNIDPAFALPPQVEVHGSYQVEDLSRIARQHGVTHWLIPSVWPETFCYTVHEALATGLPVMAFDLGAQGDAVRAAGNGIVLPFHPDADLAARVIDALPLLAMDKAS